MTHDVEALKLRNNVRGIAASSIDGSNFAEEIELFDKSIQSGNYLPGTDGWKIDGSGNAEFGNVFVRGDINAETGTIGYWNISSPAVERTFGTTKLFGTFLESSDFGPSDADVNSGTYVSLFKSYNPSPMIINSIEVSGNSVIVTAPGHPFLVDDKITVSYGPNDAGSSVYSQYESVTYVTVTDATDDTFTYLKPVSDNGGGTNNLANTVVAGTAQLVNEDVAGLYLRDYGRIDFDYGYFSNKGIKYVAADKVNLVHNPSFEYRALEGKTFVATGAVVELPVGNFATVYAAGHGLVEDQAIVLGYPDVPQINLGGIFIDDSYFISNVTLDTFEIQVTDTSFVTYEEIIRPIPIYAVAQNGSSFDGWAYENASASVKSVTRAVLGTNIATLTTSAAHGYSVGETAVVSGIDSVFNGTYKITESTVARTISTFTVTIANPGVLTVTAHGLTAGQQVYLTTTGALPTGLTSAINYYVKTVVSANSITLTNVRGGTAIQTSGTQSGTHTIYTTHSFSYAKTNTNVLNSTVAGSSYINYAYEWPISGPGSQLSSMDTENARSEVGFRPLTYTTANSDYLVGSVDYKAAVDYKIIEADRPLYFGFDMYYSLSPVAVGATVTAAAVTRVADKAITVKARSSNIATITTSTAHTFTAGLQVEVETGDATFDGTFLIISTPTSTTFTYASVGSNTGPSSASGNTYSTYTTITTGATAHGLAVDDLVYLDFDATDTAGIYFSDWRFSTSNQYLAAMHAYQPNGYGLEYAKVFKVLGVPTTTTFRIVNVLNESAASAITVTGTTNVDGTTRAATVYRQQMAVYDLDQIKIQFGSDSTTTLSEILTDSYYASWSTYRYLRQYDYTNWMNTYLDPTLETKIPMLSSGGLIELSAKKIKDLYSQKAPTEYAAEDLFEVKFPLWMYTLLPTGTISGTKATFVSGNIGFALDSVYISTSREYFYGDMDDTSTSWYDSGYELEIPRQSSISLSKTWIDIDLESQTGVLDYLDYVGFKPAETTRYYFSSPSVSSKPLVDYQRGLATQSLENGLWVYPGDLSEKSSLTLTSGAYQNYTTPATGPSFYSLYEGAVKSYSGIDFAGLELAAHRLQSDVAGLVDPSASTRATIDLYVDQADRSMIEIDSDMVLITGAASTANITATSSYANFQIGDTSLLNLAMNNNQIQVRQDGVATTLWLNPAGGQVRVASTFVASANIDNNAAYSTANDWAAAGLTRKAMWINSSGILGNAASSSRKVKRDFAPLGYDYNSMIAIEPMRFKYIQAVESLGDSAPIEIGLIAEDLHDAGLTEMVYYDENGEVEGINYTSYVVALQSIARSQHDMILSLSSRLDALEAK
jgi:hypothetical protein